MSGVQTIIDGIDPTRPILLAGPTASGKSALALRLAQVTGGPVVNADALQVYADWRVLTARPSAAEESEWPHRLYGHVTGDRGYSVGDWLRDVAPYLDGPPPVIVGGTGLYFAALTEGLSEIPATPPGIRERADALRKTEGVDALIAALDAKTASRIDTRNPMRVQRAWEVQQATGRGLASWQDDTGPPMLPLSNTTPLVLDAPKDWLTPRIERRFDMMLGNGALEEARRNAPDWDPTRPASRAIGAAELIAHVQGNMTLAEAREAAVIATRQYAKRQRTWFRARMSNWTAIDARAL